MKFTCERSILLKEITIAQEIISSKNAISILSNIYLEAKDDTLTIKSTDIKVNFITKVPVMVIDEGITTVFGDKFLGILNSIPDGELEFDQKDTKIVIQPLNKKIKFQLKSIASDKFPEFPAPNIDVSFEVPVKDFKDMITQTVFAVSDDETRYFMNGVFCEKQENKLVMVGTDGRRLAYIHKEVGDEIADFAGIIIPTKMLNIILRRAGDEGLISLAITDKIIFVTFGSYQLSSVLIEGQFPNYQRVIPENQTHFFSMNRLEMLDALRRVSLLVEKSRRVYLKVVSGLISVSSEEGEIGTASEDIPAKYEGDEVSIALNYRYIEEPFKAMTGNEVGIHFSETNRAITIKPVPEDNYFHIIMPMQID
ncbi:MAG: DNA polymerase III subunit beta [Spirochaetaceae bacterium]|jgi:DNA polymerase-3 subunit beta|nr:DNA polymerase III subunit beta [Spirochaetaceae bacterium]